MNDQNLNLTAAEARTLLAAATERDGVRPDAASATALAGHWLITPYTAGAPGAAIYGATEAGVRWLAQSGHAEEVRRVFAHLAAECTANGNGVTAWHYNEMTARIDAWAAESA